jgi:hypothetical protein
MGLTLIPRIAILDFCDRQFQSSAGRAVAVRLAAQLNVSGRYRVIERSVWQRLLGGRELSQECRLHPAWATQIGTLAGVDAVVIGSVHGSVCGQMAMAATMLDLNGIILVNAAHSTVEGLAELLSRSRVADKISVCNYPIRATVTCIGDALIILDAGATSGLKRADRLRIDRILETVSDPYFQDRQEIIACLTANIGTAEVLDAGPGAALAHYTGIQPARAGDLVTRLEF